MEIYGTLGPGCGSTDTLEAMFRAGMTGMRLNLSHSTLRASASLLDAFHEAASRADVTPGLLIDMQGPELRVGALAAPLTLEENALIKLDDIPLPAPVRPLLTAGQRMLLDDGKLLLEVSGGGKARILRGGLLQSRKSLALPGLDVRLPALTEADKENLRDAVSFGVTGVMQPFVRGRADLEAVRAALGEAGCGHVRLFAKIENMAGVEKLSELIPAADEIVIARGDLGNAMALWDLPAAQKRIAAQCRAAHKPFMVVTQMLASMETRPVPTRAEVSDIFNAVLDGAASVMVTGETAAGQHPVEVIKYLVNTVRSAEQYIRLGGGLHEV